MSDRHMSVEETLAKGRELVRAFEILGLGVEMIKLHRFKPKGEYYHQRIIRTHDHYYVLDGKLTEKQLEQWHEFDQELSDIQACAMSQALRKAIKEFDKTNKVPTPEKIAEEFFRW